MKSKDVIEKEREGNTDTRTQQTRVYPTTASEQGMLKVKHAHKNS